MPADPPSYQRRDRAESFGLIAGEYDRFRPSYPAELIDDLVAPDPQSVLDVGCGTGKAAVLLAARGRSVLGVEIDPHMAAVARRHGIDVEISGFEEWQDHGRQFDLITSGQAWHWIDPGVGARKAARLMRPAATLALFWNYENPDSSAAAVLQDVYRRLEPTLVEGGVPTEVTMRSHRAPLEATGVFGRITARDYPRQSTMLRDDFVSRLGTQSALVTLGPIRLATLADTLRRELDDTVTLTGGTHAIFARDPRH